jgi:hypothetical protein
MISTVAMTCITSKLNFITMYEGLEHFEYPRHRPECAFAFLQ